MAETLSLEHRYEKTAATSLSIFYCLYWHIDTIWALWIVYIDHIPCITICIRICFSQESQLNLFTPIWS